MKILKRISEVDFEYNYNEKTNYIVIRTHTPYRLQIHVPDYLNTYCEYEKITYYSYKNCFATDDPYETIATIPAFGDSYLKENFPEVYNLFEEEVGSLTKNVSYGGNMRHIFEVDNELFTLLKAHLDLICL